MRHISLHSLGLKKIHIICVGPNIFSYDCIFIEAETSFCCVDKKYYIILNNDLILNNMVDNFVFQVLDETPLINISSLMISRIHEI